MVVYICVCIHFLIMCEFILVGIYISFLLINNFKVKIINL